MFTHSLAPESLIAEQSKQARAHKEEIMLRDQYATSLRDNVSAVYLCPDFNTKPLYDAIARDEQQVMTYRQIANQAAIAINSLAVFDLAAALKVSAIPLRILHTQQTLRLRWEWLQHNKNLFFYKRITTILTIFEKTFFYKKSLPELINANSTTPPIVELAQAYQTQLMPSVTGDNNILYVNNFVQTLDLPDNLRLKMLLNHLTSHAFYDNYKAATHRQLEEDDRNAIAIIFSTQLKSQSVKIFFSEGFLSLLINDLTHQHITYSQHSLNPADLYPHYAAYRYKILLTEIEEKLYAEFMDWLNATLPNIHDLAVLDLEIKKTFSKRSQLCDKLVAEQQKVNTYILERETELANQELLNVSLEEQDFFIFDTENNISNPLLHLALKKYANVTCFEEKAKALTSVELLIKRGCSPYTKNRFQGAPARKTREEQNAFAYAGITPNWQLLAITLKSMITRSHFADLIRLELLRNCECMLKDSEWKPLKAFSSNLSITNFNTEVAQLVEVLHEATVGFSDIKLINQIKSLPPGFGIDASMKERLNLLVGQLNNLLFIDPTAKTPLSPVAGNRRFFPAANSTPQLSSSATSSTKPPIPPFVRASSLT